VWLWWQGGWAKAAATTSAILRRNRFAHSASVRVCVWESISPTLSKRYALSSLCPCACALFWSLTNAHTQSCFVCLTHQKGIWQYFYYVPELSQHLSHCLVIPIWGIILDKKYYPTSILIFSFGTNRSLYNIFIFV